MDPYIMNRVWTSPFPRVPIAITPSLSELSSAPLSSTPSSASSSTYPVTPSAALRPFGVEYEAYMTLLTCALILIVWVGGVILWYLYCIRRPPRLFRGRGHLIRAVTDDCPSLQRPYCPPIWCISPWAQAGVSLQRTTSIRAQLCQLVGEDAWDADQEETAGTEEAGEARVEERE
ncbi:hypothetical protein NGA_0207100, partial [Nannochloropsis gaditana CCMP526]|uniref:uncharacterized protein n=1 Tax=Nannochloropsis gaditana (strain CCMP526) TaxID=1093141 RepID=UPI00029F7C0F